MLVLGFICYLFLLEPDTVYAIDGDDIDRTPDYLRYINDYYYNPMLAEVLYF